MKPLSKKKLATIEIDANDTGFTIWIVSKNKLGQKVKHWVLDGSCLLDDGIVRLGRNDMYSINAVFNEEEQAIMICKR